MSSLIYLTLTTAKNKFRNMLSHPGRIIMYLLFFAFIFFNVFRGGLSSQSRDINELYAIIFGFFTLNFAVTVYEGFNSGGTIFSLSDVTFLFPSPVKPSLIILYGMLNRLGASVVFGLAFIYEYPLLMSSYNLSFADFAVILLFFGLTVFLSRIISMIIYFFSCGDENKKKLFKTAFFLILLLLAATIIIEGELYNGFSLESLLKGVTSPYVKLFPVSGVMLWAIEGYMTGRLTPVIICLCLIGLFVFISFLVLTKSKRSYYEDVVLSSTKSTSADNMTSESAPSKVRDSGSLGKSGLGFGSGAAAIFSKHIKENFRSKRLFITGTTVISLVFVVASMFSMGDIISVFVGSISIMSLSVLSARWYSELGKPYIYLIPQSPVKKLFFACLEQAPVLFAESIICLLPALIIARLLPFDFIAMVLSRVSFGMLMLSSSLLTYKILPKGKIGRAHILINSLVAMVFSVPAVAVMYLSSMIWYNSLALSFLLAIPVNFVLTAVLFFLSRNLLTKNEIRN
ncbi:MAG: putative ABC exporter domain-containing protein [Acutalibacteraceae bacterium]